MADTDPPLYASLAAMHDLTTRHRLREDRRMPHDPPPGRVPAADTDYDSAYGTGTAYGADDDPQGPPSPPLDVPTEPTAAPRRPETEDASRVVEPSPQPAYGADDDPQGPTPPPLDRHIVDITACRSCRAPILQVRREEAPWR